MEVVNIPKEQEPLSEIDLVRQIIQRDDTPYKGIPLENIPKNALRHFLEWQTLSNKEDVRDDNEVKERLKWLRREPVFWGLLPILKHKINNPMEALERKRKASRECHQRKTKILKREKEKKLYITLKQKFENLSESSNKVTF